jgi:hypothetical protein
MKIILSLAIYLVVTFALGLIMAMTAPREDSGPEQAEGL